MIFARRTDDRQTNDRRNRSCTVTWALLFQKTNGENSKL